jgi:curved DNA-binding protein CbpA
VLLRAAVKKFLELTHARDVLLDPKQKEAYDKKLSRELMAKKQQAELDAKRRQMRDGRRRRITVTARGLRSNGRACCAELLRKEQASSLPRKTSARRDKSDLSKLREKGVARQKELEERLARDARRQRDLERARQAVDSSTRFLLVVVRLVARLLRSDLWVLRVCLWPWQDRRARRSAQSRSSGTGGSSRTRTRR